MQVESTHLSWLLDTVHRTQVFSANITLRTELEEDGELTLATSVCVAEAMTIRPRTSRATVLFVREREAAGIMSSGSLMINLPLASSSGWFRRRCVGSTL